MRALLRNASLLFNPMHVLHERRALCVRTSRSLRLVRPREPNCDDFKTPQDGHRLGAQGRKENQPE
jgi:hypothetical protein